eukprot:9486431-Pyramimonas_sp.AAC.1
MHRGMGPSVRPKPAACSKFCDPPFPNPLLSSGPGVRGCPTGPGFRGGGSSRAPFPGPAGPRELQNRAESCNDTLGQERLGQPPAA